MENEEMKQGVFYDFSPTIPGLTEEENKEIREDANQEGIELRFVEPSMLKHQYAFQISSMGNAPEIHSKHGVIYADMEDFMLMPEHYVKRRFAARITLGEFIKSLYRAGYESGSDDAIGHIAYAIADAAGNREIVKALCERTEDYRRVLKDFGKGGK